MFNFSWSEIALLVVVALIFIGPKDLPVAMRTLSKAIRGIRRMASEFQQHIDEMVREADLSETRDQLNELRQFNFRDQVRRAVDPKDEIRRNMGEDMTSSTDEAHLPPPPDGVLDDQETSDEPYNARMKARAEALENAPFLLPPTTALRLIEEASYWKRPSILPPEMALHYGKRVPILTEFAPVVPQKENEEVADIKQAKIAQKEDEHGHV